MRSSNDCFVRCGLGVVLGLVLFVALGRPLGPFLMAICFFAAGCHFAWAGVALRREVAEAEAAVKRWQGRAAPRG
jgi:hypothetical protein